MRIATNDDALQGSGLEFILCGAMDPCNTEHRYKVSEVRLGVVEHFEGGCWVVVALMERWEYICHFGCSFYREPPILRRECG